MRGLGGWGGWPPASKGWVKRQFVLICTVGVTPTAMRDTKSTHAPRHAASADALSPLPLLAPVGVRAFRPMNEGQI